MSTGRVGFILELKAGARGRRPGRVGVGSGSGRGRAQGRRPGPAGPGRRAGGRLEAGHKKGRPAGPPFWKMSRDIKHAIGLATHIRLCCGILPIKGGPEAPLLENRRAIPWFQCVGLPGRPQ